MADPIIDINSAAAIRRSIQELAQRLRNLETPDASQFNRTAQKMLEIINNIDQIAADAIAKTSYPAATIDAKDATVKARADAAYDLANFSVLPAVRGGTNTANAYSNEFTTGAWRAAWILADGTLGTSQSTRRVKQDMHAPAITVEQLRRAQWVIFRYIADVQANGQNATWRVGMIAEDLEDAGLGIFCTRDESGRVDGIDYATLSVAALHLAQQAWDQLDILDARISTLESQEEK